MTLTKTSFAMINGSEINVLDKGADPTGANSSVQAFNDAAAVGGSIRVPSGTYKLDGKITFSVDDTALFLDANVTLLLSGVAAVQTPFGNQLHFFANNCSIIGSGPSSLLQITDGSQANAIGILHHSNLTVKDLTIDGGKSSGSAIIDDTFMSGVSIVSTTAGGATTDVNVIIDNCEIRNFLQYGVNIYGNQANGVKIVNCNIHDNGKTGDALSVGAGIVVTAGPSDFIAANNVLKNNKYAGIFISSAGISAANYAITGNLCHQNGQSGILFLEESNLGCINNIGLEIATVTGNVCTGNVRSGIQLAVVTVGFLKYFAITGNTTEGNTLAGIEVNTTNTSPNIISNIQISGNLSKDNGSNQIFVGQYVQNVEGASQSFVPSIIGSITPGTATYGAGSPVGLYQKIGNIVYYQIEANWSAHTGTGDLVISNFPYAAANAEPVPVGWVWANGLTITGQASFGLSGGQTQGTLVAVNNGTVSTVPLDTSAALRLNGFYFTS